MKGYMTTSKGLIALLTLMIMGTGCGTDSGRAEPDPGESTQKITCNVNADCPAQQVCQAGVCAVVPSANTLPASTEHCENGLDDDGDSAVDCDDLDCQREPACYSTGSCNGAPCPCDVLAQDCANPGERCWPGGEFAKDGACYPIGPQGQGDPCEEPPVDGPLACAKGLICVAQDEQDQPTCRALCGSSADCQTDESCYLLELIPVTTVDYGVCVPTSTTPPPPPPPCDVFAQDCGDAADMCVPQQAGGNICVPGGSGAGGSQCTAAEDCLPGLMCAALVGTSPGQLYFGFGDIRGGNCLPLCAPASPACPPGTTCSPVLDSYSGAPRVDIGVCAQ